MCYIEKKPSHVRTVNVKKCAFLATGLEAAVIAKKGFGRGCDDLGVNCARRLLWLNTEGVTPPAMLFGRVVKSLTWRSL